MKECSVQATRVHDWTGNIVSKPVHRIDQIFFRSTLRILAVLHVFRKTTVSPKSIRASNEKISLFPRRNWRKVPRWDCEHFQKWEINQNGTLSVKAWNKMISQLPCPKKQEMPLAMKRKFFFTSAPIWLGVNEIWMLIYASKATVLLLHVFSAVRSLCEGVNVSTKRLAKFRKNMN
jgi:hypothetical protein